eukprot:59748-Rhodomonas_salina.1
MESGSVERRGWCPLWSQNPWNGEVGVPCGVRVRGTEGQVSPVELVSGLKGLWTAVKSVIH